MKKKKTLLLALLCSVQLAWSNKPDSLYLFSYLPAGDDGKAGLHLAYSAKPDGAWQSVGDGDHSFLKSDFGTWGAQKRMLSPSLLQLPGGEWVVLFALNEQINAFGVARSRDLVHWLPQDYHYVTTPHCADPVIIRSGDSYRIAYRSGEEHYAIKTRDFRHFSEAEPLSAAPQNPRGATAELAQGSTTGEIHRVSRDFVENLEQSVSAARYRNGLYAENTGGDARRFKNLQQGELTLSVSGQEKAISDKLIGIFFEDINYAADGGLYAELVQNRDFEYSSRDNDRWNATTAWSLTGGGELKIETDDPIHANNAHYALLPAGATLQNEGFDGIALRKGDKYDFSLFARAQGGKGTSVTVRLASDGKTLAEKKLSVGGSWKKIGCTLVAQADAQAATLQLSAADGSDVAVDMVSLFPQKTFKNRKNGLRADLAQTLADLHPRFVRFPGGCVTHGNGIDNIYRWKNSVGPLEARKGDFNIWGYHQSMGLGFYEYFTFCEDIGAMPLPVLAAGVPCQNSSRGGDGQQGGIPMEQMGSYIQEICDLIEWANGDKNSTWGRVRALAGHPKPFGLKYIGIGNEDLISDVFKERFQMIFEALKERHPEITVVGTVGPFYEGSDYEEGWRFATRLGVPVVDEHYYVSPGWMLHNQNYYDNYSRKGPKVYLGEYAAHLPGRPNNIETALAEALHLTNVERNADVVEMTSYAPLLAKEGHTQWNPDLIYFNNHEVKPTVGYYAQLMCGQNSGSRYLTSALRGIPAGDEAARRLSASVVRDTVSDELIVKMVNLLPTAMKLTLDLPGEWQPYSRTVLSGEPADRTAKPVSAAMQGERTVQLPAYSFTVVRARRQAAAKRK